MFRLFFILLLLSSVVRAQQDDYSTTPHDNYLFKVGSVQKITTARCDKCADNILRFRYGRCALYKVEISEVLLIRDTTVYHNAEELKKVKYIIIPVQLLKQVRDIGINDIFYCHSTFDKKFLTVHKIKQELYNNEILILKGSPYIGGPLGYPKYNIFDRIKLRLNINREKIYEKGLSKGYYIPKSRFLKYIDD